MLRDLAPYCPVKQLFHHRPDEGVFGDCMRACIASLLGLPAADVPHWNDGRPRADCELAMRIWLASRGLVLVEIPMAGDLDAVLTSIDAFNPGLRFLLSGHSRTGCDHIVVCQSGRIIHDPSLTDAGIVGPCKGSDPELYWISVLVPASAHAGTPDDATPVSEAA